MSIAVFDHFPGDTEVMLRMRTREGPRTLRFGTGLSLEQLILCHALGRPIASLDRERRAAGVMMIPIPRAGRLRAVRGADEARTVPGIDDVTITAHREQELVPRQERELAAEMAPPAEALILSNIFTPVHTDGLTRTGSARECFRFKGAIRAGLFKGAIRVGLVAAA